MSELISGKEALIAWFFDNHDVQLKYKNEGHWDIFELAEDCYSLDVFKDHRYEFRLKPRTITLNNIEVPAPFEPKLDDRFFYIDANYPDGFNYGFWEGSLEEKCRSQFGTWRTEEEIKQVVDALRSIFNVKR